MQRQPVLVEDEVEQALIEQAVATLIALGEASVGLRQDASVRLARGDEEPCVEIALAGHAEPGRFGLDEVEVPRVAHAHEALGARERARVPGREEHQVGVEIEDVVVVGAELEQPRLEGRARHRSDGGDVARVDMRAVRLVAEDQRRQAREGPHALGCEARHLAVEGPDPDGDGDHRT